MSIYAHAITLTASRPLQRRAKPGGGIRGKVEGFSRAARRRMISYLKKINPNEVGSMAFASLTYHENWENRNIKRDRENFLQRIQYHFPGIFYIWRLEAQRRGAPHFHIILLWPPDKTSITDAETDAIGRHWHNTVDKGNIHHAEHGADVQVVENGFEYAEKYLAKYCSKEDGTPVDISDYTGRHWGKSQNLPTAPLKEMVLNERRQEVEAYRMCRKYLEKHPGKRARRFSKSVVCGHNSELWLKEGVDDFQRQLARYIEGLAYPIEPTICYPIKPIGQASKPSEEPKRNRHRARYPIWDTPSEIKPIDLDGKVWVGLSPDESAQWNLWEDSG